MYVWVAVIFCAWLYRGIKEATIVDLWFKSQYICPTLILWTTFLVCSELIERMYYVQSNIRDFKTPATTISRGYNCSLPVFASHYLTIKLLFLCNGHIPLSLARELVFSSSVILGTYAYEDFLEWWSPPFLSCPSAWRNDMNPISLSYLTNLIMWYGSAWSTQIRLE